MWRLTWGSISQPWDQKNGNQELGAQPIAISRCHTTCCFYFIKKLQAHKKKLRAHAHLYTHIIRKQKNPTKNDPPKGTCWKWTDYISFFFFFLGFYLFDREKEREHKYKQGEQQKDREKQAPHWAGRPIGGPSQDPGIMNGAEGWCFTDWATQVPYTCLL